MGKLEWGEHSGVCGRFAINIYDMSKLLLSSYSLEISAEPKERVHIVHFLSSSIVCTCPYAYKDSSYYSSSSYEGISRK